MKDLGVVEGGKALVVSAFANSGDVHDALCRATVRVPWSFEDDAEEMLLKNAQDGSWEAQVLEARKAMLIFSQFAGNEKCPRCGAVGTYEWDEQTRSADEASSRVKVFSCRHWIRLA